MKNTTITFVLLFVFLFASEMFSQNFQGKAYYKTSRDFKMELDSTSSKNTLSVDQKALQEMIKKQMQKTYILTFDKTKSLYKEEEKLEQPTQTGGITITIGNPNDVLFKDIKTKIYVDSKESYGKQFVVKDSLKSNKWKFEKETKKIGKYTCLKATATKLVDDYEGFKKKEKQKEIKITAWYTPEIPVSNGPEFYFGLPGLILELHEDKMHYLLTKLVLNPKNKIKIEEPTKGKKVNQKQYDKIMEKKNKEMMESFKSNRKKGNNVSTQTIIIN